MDRGEASNKSNRRKTLLNEWTFLGRKESFLYLKPYMQRIIYVLSPINASISELSLCEQKYLLLLNRIAKICWLL